MFNRWKHSAAVLGVLLTLFFVGCSTQERKVVNQWSTIWADRLLSSIKDASEEQKKTMQVFEEAASGLSSKNVKKEDVIHWYMKMMKSRLEASRKYGQYKALREFLDHLEKSPTFEMTKLWFIQQIDLAKSSGEKNVNEAKDFINVAARGDRVDWADFVVDIMNEQGLIRGKNEELEELWDEYLGYAKDRQAAKEEDIARNRQIALLFALAAGSMARYSYQQQILNALNRPRTCFAFRTMINCY